MNLKFYSFYGTKTGLGTEIANIITSLGGTASASSGNVTINAWKRVSSTTFAAIGSTSNANYTITINDEMDKEMLFVISTDALTTGTNMNIVLNTPSGVVSSSGVAYPYFGLPCGNFSNVDKMEISKLLSFGSATSSTPTKDITNLNLYCANGLVAPNVTYKDKANIEYVGLNQFLLMKKG